MVKIKFFNINLESNLSKRFFSAVILVAVILLLNYIGGFLFKFVVFALLLLSIMEGNKIIQNDSVNMPKKRRGLWSFFGLLFLMFAFVSFICIRDLEHGPSIILFILCVVWSTDIGAYAAGNVIGGPKICPKVSPNKTISGCIGGIILAILVSLPFSYVLCGKFSSEFLMYTLIISIIAQLGDFLESYFKRKFQVKDSGNIIPGHGGILDRIDSLLTVSLVYWVILDHYVSPLLIK